MCMSWGALRAPHLYQDSDIFLWTLINVFDWEKIMIIFSKALYISYYVNGYKVSYSIMMIALSRSRIFH